MSTGKLYVSYQDIHRHTSNLVAQIKEMGLGPITYVAALSRGGLVPGVIMSHQLGVPLYPIRWSTRDHEEQTHYADISADLYYEETTIILVDDINDSGRTFIDLLNDWQYDNRCNGRLVTATLYQRYTTNRPSDICSEMIHDERWVVFPWELENE